MNLLSIRNLTASVHGRPLLDNISITVNAGETIGLVGESGSGKSLTALAAIGMLPASVCITDGSISCCGKDVRRAGIHDLRKLRGREAALIFQDPMQALMPTRRVGSQLTDVLRAHCGKTGAEAKRVGTELFQSMGLTNPERIWNARPFELSGGQRQRALIAIALAVNPKLVIADEITTALDPEARRDVLTLITRKVSGAGKGIVLISHDLATIRGTCDRVYVMFQGRIVEHGSAAEIIDSPTDPYTQMLLASLPERSAPKAKLPVRLL